MMGEQADWVVVVDDDIANLKLAGGILSEEGLRVSAMNSGKALLDFMAKGHQPDLILLDVLMAEMDGYETFRRLKEMQEETVQTPVIFLTADEDRVAESRGLAMGAMDFIRKPLEPEVLTIRVKHIIELTKLQNDLAAEVARKTSENEQLFIQFVLALTDAVDAKDTYTHGHSRRVARYAREIANKAGYDPTAQNEIYMIALLHDIGKIGVPDEIINKTTKLTDEEFAQIKTHPVRGAQILANIRNNPKLATGAKWHHERYGGGGYPDGLVGEEIPEEARIIAVADAYDAMTSNRSYRDIMPQEQVRAQIEGGKGIQFDPRFADIMLALIDEDVNYEKREK